MSTPLWVILPLKEMAVAKQRLAGVLTPPERQRLFGAMVHDTLAAVSAHPNMSGTLLVSNDSAGAALSRAYGAECVSERALQARGVKRSPAGGGSTFGRAQDRAGIDFAR